MKKYTSILALLLCGCAFSKQTIGPSGAIAHTVSCGAMDVSSCYEKMGEVCPKGYEILSHNRAGYGGQIGSAAISPGYGSAFSVPIFTPNDFFIECNE